MENRFKLRFSRFFQSSFGSCRTRKISDVIEKPIFSPQNDTVPLVDRPLQSPSPPPKARPFPSICKPRCPESPQNALINHDCIMITPRETIPRRKVFARFPPFVVSSTIDHFDGRKYPPSKPISPLSFFSDCKDFGFYEKKKSIARHKTKKKKKKKKRVHVHFKNATFFSSSSQESATNNYYYNNNNHGTWWWLSSEDETDTLFSSRNLSSDSSESFSGRRRRQTNRKRHDSTRRRRAKNKSFDHNMGVLPLEGTSNNNGKVKDSFAVVKRSSDPYNDFRTSMVEMIVERQIFAARDLEQLLQCFLSLNSHHHHKIIIEVFTEIWETLFSTCS